MGNSINVHDFLKHFSSWLHLSSVYKYVIVNLYLLFFAMNPNTVHFDKRFLHKNWFFPLLCNVWCLNQNGCNWSHFPLGVMWPDINWPWRRLLHERPFTREGNYLFWICDGSFCQMIIVVRKRFRISCHYRSQQQNSFWKKKMIPVYHVSKEFYCERLASSWTEGILVWYLFVLYKSGVLI